MKTRIKIVVILIVIIVISISCDKEKGRTVFTGREIFDFGNHAESIIVNKYADYEIVEYCYKGEDTNEVIEWFYCLQLEEVAEIPDSVDGNVLYEFIVDGEEQFTYDDGGEGYSYIVIGGKRYKVKNYSFPSLENAEKRVICSYDMEDES